MSFLLRKSRSDKVEFVISVSKKVAKKAVTRNLIKRRIRPILRVFGAKLAPAKYLLIAQLGAETLAGRALQAELKRLFKLQ